MVVTTWRAVRDADRRLSSGLSVHDDDNVLGALDVVAGLRPPAPAKATRVAQGLLDDRGSLTDPLEPDRVTTRT